MNNEFVHERAAGLVRRVMAGAKDEAARLALAWNIALGRSPSRDEVADATAFLKQYTVFNAEQCDGLFLSDISYLGVALPIEQLLAEVTPNFGVIDGAQAFHQRRVNLSKLPCDLYLTGTQKWFGAFQPLRALFVGRTDNLQTLNQSAENGSFFDVANQVGWTFPEVLEEGNWDAMPTELQAKANIQCEHCHGAGSEHHGIKSAISVSLNAGDCAQCHDDEPYHVKNAQWNLSRHAVATRYPTGERRGSCVRCHSGIGFIETLDGLAEVSTDYEAITCAACHDPHSAENDHQVRTVADVTLENGHVVTEGGTGKLCMNCHKSRRNAVEYVEGNVSSHYGPHYGIQGDLFNGTNAIEYDGKVKGGASAHLYATENACATCHMQGTSSDDAFNNLAGGHTFKVAWDNDTPDDHHDEQLSTATCTCVPRAGRLWRGTVGRRGAWAADPRRRAAGGGSPGARDRYRRRVGMAGGAVAVSAVEGLGDKLFFHGFEGYWLVVLRGVRRGMAERVGQMGYLNHTAFAENESVFDDILEFTDIAGIIMFHKAG